MAGDWNSQYDARFADAWKRLLSTFDAPDALQKRLLSEPATQGTYWTVGGTKGFLYTLCQSNACSTTNLTIFYQPESSKIGGRLLQRCQIAWIGTVGDDVKRLINSVAPIQAKDLNRKPECQIAERHADTATSHIATPRDSDSPPSQQQTADCRADVRG